MVAGDAEQVTADVAALGGSASHPSLCWDGQPFLLSKEGSSPAGFQCSPSRQEAEHSPEEASAGPMSSLWCLRFTQPLGLYISAPLCWALFPSLPHDPWMLQL